MVQMKHRTKAQKRRRASHFALAKANLTKCGHCGQPVMPHCLCDFCGYYRGRQVIAVEAKKLKKAKAAKAKEEKEAKKEAKEKGKEKKK
jgi:large subunit ribosomal protein L32